MAQGHIWPAHHPMAGWLFRLRCLCVFLTHRSSQWPEDVDSPCMPVWGTWKWNIANLKTVPESEVNRFFFIQALHRSSQQPEEVNSLCVPVWSTWKRIRKQFQNPQDSGTVFGFAIFHFQVPQTGMQNESTSSGHCEALCVGERGRACRVYIEV